VNRRLPAFHDSLVVGYEVDCEARELRLHIRPPVSDAAREGVSTVVFAGVQGYHFEHDAFGNIVFDLESVPMEWFVTQNRSELDEFHRFGALGAWAADLDAAPAVLSGLGIQAFVLSASLGLTGWVLAKEASVRP
jgi:hypothetical protein